MLKNASAFAGRKVIFNRFVAGNRPATKQPKNVLPHPPAYQTAINVTFERNAVSMVCPHCYHQIVTRTSPKCGPFKHCLSPAMFLLGCWLCFLISLCLKSCKDIVHICPNCGKTLGVYHKRI